MTIDPATSYFHGFFIAVDDYLSGTTAQNQNVVGKVGNFHLMYNRKIGLNSQVQGDADTVTVIEQPNSGAISWNSASLTDASDPFVIANWTSPGVDLVIQVCERRLASPNYARVLVHLSTDSVTCSSALTQEGPTLPPTLAPSPAPPPPPGTVLSLKTTDAGGNGSNGNMFDVESKNDLTIQSFKAHLDGTSTYTVEVHMREGTYKGFESNSNAWELLQTIQVQGKGAGNLTPLPPLPSPIPLQAGAKRAFYVTATTTNIDYTNGNSAGAVYAADSNLDICEGVGKTYPFGSTYSPRYVRLMLVF